MGTPGGEIPLESTLSHTEKLQQLFGENLASIIGPYFERLYGFNGGILEGIAILTEKLQSLNLTSKEKKQIALAMTLSDLGKGKQIVEGNNKPSAERYFIYWLYAFREVLSQEEKKTLTLDKFFTEKLLTFVQGKGGDTELLKEGYGEFLTSDRLKNYCVSHEININNISMSQAWSIFHVLMGEEVWDDIENQLTKDSPEKNEFQSARKLAELHHAAEGVFIEKVERLSDDEIKQLGVIILIDKIESYRGRMESNIIPIHGRNIVETLRNQWKLDVNHNYIANTDLVHINNLITLFQTSQFPDNIKKIFLSLLWEIYPHLLRRTKILKTEEIAKVVNKTVDDILNMNPEELEEIINTDELRVAIRQLFRNGSLVNPTQVNTGQRKYDLNQKAAA